MDFAVRRRRKSQRRFFDCIIKKHMCNITCLTITQPILIWSLVESIHPAPLATTCSPKDSDDDEA